MSTTLDWVIGVAAGLLFAWLGEPWLRRHPLAACWFYAAAAVFFAAASVLNAVTRQWWWAAAEAVIAVAAAWTCWKYLARRKAAKEATVA